ncbi:hypothetical protein Poly30_24820 [Planctomycetes bacterium Poly30]|uniref:Uncharacterized protein n=1 Tax=Saltatorellus ferox TaxID=2528018 RepID=A0A518ES98_9BACT|nr:hypothetical protein Poly30_24820 [Planctomycetes bacterium Poly30]
MCEGDGRVASFFLEKREGARQSDGTLVGGEVARGPLEGPCHEALDAAFQLEGFSSTSVKRKSR